MGGCSIKPVGMAYCMVCAGMTQKPSPSRRWAANAITAIFDDGISMDDYIASPSGFAKMSQRDRALARAIAGSVLRRHGQIEAVLDAYLAKPLPRKASLMQAILYCACAEILYLRSPGFAVVSDTVSLADSSVKTRPFKNLANAVLRKVAANAHKLVDETPVSQNIPLWLRESWQSAYGDGVIANAGAVLAQDQPIDLTVFTDMEKWTQALGGTVLGPNTLRLQAGAKPEGDITQWPGFEDGAWQVQDAAAALPAMILAANPGERIVDLCAAPGGKSAQLAASGAEVWAIERAAKRLKRLQSNMQRLGVSLTSVCADAREWQPDAPVDAVLVDAPCTATGVFRRHPDVLAIKTPANVASLLDKQFSILKAASQMLRPAGRLVYCVCSAQTEEGEDIASRALQELSLKPLAIDGAALPYGGEFACGHELRIPPGAWADKGGLDAFYMAVFART